MYINSLGVIVTRLDVIFLAFTVLSFAPPSSKFASAITSQDVISVLVQSVSESATSWIALSVIALVWSSHRQAVQKTLSYTNDSANKMLLLSAFGPARRAIRHCIDQAQLAATDYEDAFGKCKTEQEARDELSRLASILQDSDYNLFVLCAGRMLRNGTVYPRSLVKLVKETKQLVVDHDLRLALLLYKILEGINEAGVWQDSSDIDVIKDRILESHGLPRRASEGTFQMVLAGHRELFESVKTKTQGYAMAYDRTRRKLSDVLRKLRNGFEEYFEHLHLDYPTGYMPATRGMHDDAGVA